MTFRYSIQTNPNPIEIHNFLEEAFNDLQDQEKFSTDQNQDLDEWFSVDEMIKYFPYGQLIEVRTSQDRLIGLIFIAIQNPVSWPDGRKMEVFVLAVDSNYRGQGIATELLSRAEKYAKNYGSKKIIINTHILQEHVQRFYEKLGYVKMGVLNHYYDNGDAIFFLKNL